MKTTAWTLFLFAVTAAAEIFGCYSVYLWLNLKRTPLWLLPGAASLALFAWLLTLTPASRAARMPLTAGFTSPHRWLG